MVVRIVYQVRTWYTTRHFAFARFTFRTKKQVLTHCCAATGSIVGVSEFSFGLFSYFSPPFGIYGRAFVFAKRGTDPVTKKQVLTHCCAATVSIVGVTEFSFGLFSYFSSPSGIYRRAFVSRVRLYQVYIFSCILRTQQRLVELARTWCTTIFFVSFRHLSACVRFPRASVSSLYFCLLYTSPSPRD